MLPAICLSYMREIAQLEHVILLILDDITRLTFNLSIIL